LEKSIGATVRAQSNGLIHGHPTQLDTCRTQFAGNLLPDWAVLLCNVLRVPLPSAVDVVFV
jgi:hypothetical protein